jgi:hypothetical protein
MCLSYASCLAIEFRDMNIDRQPNKGERHRQRRIAQQRARAKPIDHSVRRSNPRRNEGSLVLGDSQISKNRLANTGSAISRVSAPLW